MRAILKVIVHDHGHSAKAALPALLLVWLVKVEGALCNNAPLDNILANGKKGTKQGKTFERTEHDHPMWLQLLF